MPTFKLDGKTIPFEPGDTIIRAANRQGIDIPHYCWHPGLSSPANCRMCLVEILPKPGQRPLSLDILELDPKTGEYKPVQKPKLQPSCYMAAAEGMEVLGDTSPHVKKARHDVQEFLLLNHPVDCPICDQSGECSLQDYWLEYQQTQKRMRDEPVHKPKGVEFGDTIVYDGERCVMCTRCVRFMAEVAKDPVLDMRERGNLNEITVSPGRKLEGHYTFMTEHVCPVGALTTKDFRFKARVWFLRTAAERVPGMRDRVQRAPRLRPSLQQGLPVSPPRQRAGQQVLDVRRGDALLQGGARRARPRGHGGPRDQRRRRARSRRRPRSSPACRWNRSRSSSSARYSLEDNWALRELALVLMGSKNLYWSGRADGYEDDILIHRDKNSNTRGVRELAPGAKPFQALLEDVAARRVTHVIALGGSAPGDTAALRQREDRDDRGARRTADEGGRRRPSGDLVGRALGHVRERAGHASGRREGARAAGREQAGLEAGRGPGDRARVRAFLDEAQADPRAAHRQRLAGRTRALPCSRRQRQRGVTHDPNAPSSGPSSRSS